MIRHVRQESWASGELAPGFFGQFSIDQYVAGARKIRNWLVSKTGTLINRPGTLDKGAVGDPTHKSRLFTFDYSDDQNYVLEVGHQFMRVFGSDGALLTLPCARVVVVPRDTLEPAQLSDDGANFTTGTTNIQSMHRLAPNANGSVIVGVAYDRYIYRSVDGGDHWTTYAIGGLGASWADVTFTGTRWVAVGSGGVPGSVGHSLDGINWTLVDVGAANTVWAGVGCNGGTVLAVGTAPVDVGVCARSVDHGQSWGAATNVVKGGVNTVAANSVVWTGSRWAVSARVTVGYPTAFDVMTADDGAAPAWVSRWSKSWESYNAAVLCNTGEEIVAVGNQFSLRSEDGGISWTEYALPLSGFYQTQVSCAAGMIVSTKGKNTIISVDGGRSWQVHPISGASSDWSSLAYLGTKTSITTPWSESDLPKLRMTQSGDMATFTRHGHAPMALTRLGGVYASPVFSFAEDFPPTNAQVVGGLAFVGVINQLGDGDHPPKEWSWVVTWQEGDGRESSPSAALTPGGTGLIALYPDRPVAISWTAVTGASRYYVYRGRNGRYGYVGVKEATAGAATEAFRDDGAVPVISDDPPAGTNPFTAKFPAVLAYMDDRRVYANTEDEPDKLFFTASGDDYDFDESFVKAKEDAFTRRLKSLRYEEIRGLVWLGELAVFTSESEWTVSGGNAPIAFDNIGAGPKTSNGSSWVHQIVVNDEVLYVQANGNEVRTLYRDADGWGSEELSEMVAHLFDGRTVIDWAYARRPFGVVWVVLDDGSVLTCTRNKRRKIAAWARHDFTGAVEAITTAMESGMDVPWFEINHLNGRRIEKMAPRHGVTLADFVGLDDATVANLIEAGSNTVSGLDRFEGETVGGWDGSNYYTAVVTAGDATFEGAAASNYWVVGYPIATQFHSLDCREARVQQKAVGRVFLEINSDEVTFTDACVLNVGDSESHLDPVRLTSANEGLLECITATEMNSGGRVFVELATPVPVEIRGITRELNVGE